MILNSSSGFLPGDRVTICREFVDHECGTVFFVEHLPINRAYAHGDSTDYIYVKLDHEQTYARWLARGSFVHIEGYDRCVVQEVGRHDGVFQYLDVYKDDRSLHLRPNVFRVSATAVRAMLIWLVAYQLQKLP
jgi:hypothetical protein